MNLTRKVWIVLAILLLITMTPTALAASETDDVSDETSATESSSFWEDVKSAGSGLYQGAKEKAPGWWQSVKDAASNAVDTVKEHGPGWVEAAQEKGSELLDKGADALQSAGEQVSGFLEDQQNQFWERTEQQIYGSSGSNSTTSSAPESSAAGDSAVDESTPPASASDTSGEVDTTPPASTPDGAAPEQNSGPDNSQSHRLVADEDTINAEGAGADEPAGDTEAEVASGPDMTLVWVAISLGLAAVACGSLYMLRNRNH